MNSKRIVSNSIILYVRLGIVTLIKLCLTRILLQNLGVEDFGLYNLLAGIILMLSFLKVALSNACQRFISVQLGENSSVVPDIFYLSYMMHMAIALIVLLIISICGALLVSYVLNIGSDSVATAHYIVQTLAFSTFVTILGVPYDSMLISKENILALSLFVVGDSLVMLIGANIIGFVNENRLFVYASIILTGNILMFTLRTLYGRYKYYETRFHFHRIKDYTIFHSILKYVRFNAISSLFVIVRNQGYSLLFNVFSGLAVNAAYGVANQVNAMITYCTEALMQPTRPVIMKEFGKGNMETTYSLTIISTKIVLLLSTMIVIVIFFNAEYILSLWLKTVPTYTVSFCRVIIMATFFLQFSQAVKALIEAIGDVKGLFMVIGYFHLVCIVFGFVLIYFYRNVVIAMLPFCIEEFIGSCYRYHLLRKYNREFFGYCLIQCVVKPISIAILLWIIMYGISYVANITGLHLLLISLPLALFIVPTFYYLLCFTHKERESIKRKITFSR